MHNPKTSPAPDYVGAVSVMDHVAADYENRARIYARHQGAECGNLAEYERAKAEAIRSAIRAMTPYLPKRCGWRGMSGGEGCVRPHGHEGGHGFSDGSGYGHNSVSSPPASGDNPAKK